MNYSRTLNNGSARDEALRRRSSTVREVDIDPKSRPDAEKPVEQKMGDRPEQAVGG
ncbi:hypothetical protein [Reyranella sp.]|uniref:hypothetical protein n=1 Tax=Reyranella sp. TaxID=1929291 RepID=UPI003D0F9236